VTSSAAPRRRLLPALLAAAALAAAAVLTTAAPASAHDELVSSDPPAGATLDAVPAEITLTYSAEILAEDGATQVQVTDETGASLAETAPVVSGTEVTQTLSPAASGVVSVVWRVVSSDGHPISGDFTFTVPAAAAAAPTPTETASSTPSASPSATTSETAAPAATPDATDPATAEASDASPLPWILLVVALLIVAGAIAYLFVARGRSGAGDGGSTGTPGR